MSNTTNAVAIINDEAFGDLIKLPKLAEAHKLSADNAKLTTDKYLAPWSKINIMTITVEDAEKIIAPIRTLRTKLAGTSKKIYDERSPHTKKMDAIGSVLIKNENSVKDDEARCKKVEDNWQLEIIRRNKVAADVAAAALTLKTAEINRKAQIATLINTKFGQDLTDKVVDMHKKFYSFTSPDELAVWLGKMKAWTPIYLGVNTNHIEGDAKEIAETLESLSAGFKIEWVNRLVAERDGLIDLRAGRILQLDSGKATEVVVDVDKFADSVMSFVEQLNTSVKDDAIKDSVNASFDSAAIPIASSPVGKRVKKKYKADTMEALQTIMQSWVQYNMKLLSIEELNKKLSFMRTAADVRLNDGSPVLEAKGLSVVDDVSTRTAKTKTDES